MDNLVAWDFASWPPPCQLAIFAACAVIIVLMVAVWYKS
jgi:hypothetical protein